MPWLIGIDEAGYGPNLGPLVQAAVSARVLENEGCLWERLEKNVRRAADPDDGRLLIDDSKLVHAGPNGLARLERGVVSVLSECKPVGQFIGDVGCGASQDDLQKENWFDPAENLPVAIESPDPVDLHPDCAAAGVAFSTPTCVVTPTPRFNALVDRWESKAVALEHGVIALLQESIALIGGDEPITIVIDKQGGRNFYAPWLSMAFPDLWIQPVRESALVSEYDLLGAGRELRIVFRPRADAESLPVALASMLAKYLREVLMRQFNGFWLGHVSGLKPTAGYPNDAKRFYEAIRPAMKKLRLEPDQVWRKK